MIGAVDLKWVKSFYLLLILLLLIFSCTSEELEDPDPPAPVNYHSGLELEILNLVNEFRIASGRKQLDLLKEISSQAYLHTDHMSRAKEICHHNFGSRYGILKKKSGAKAMGENVGSGFRTSEALVNAWMTSSHHRKVLEGEHTHFGISALEEEGITYVTLILIRR